MFPIFYADRFKESFNQVYSFIDENFGKSAANKFLVTTERKISLIAKTPLMYKSSVLDVSIRTATISKQTTFFYQIFDDKIVLLFLWDNRQYPLINS